MDMGSDRADNCGLKVSVHVVIADHYRRPGFCHFTACDRIETDPIHTVSFNHPGRLRLSYPILPIPKLLPSLRPFPGMLLPRKGNIRVYRA